MDTMEFAKDKKVLVSGASIAGLSTAWWMNDLGYKVTVVELAGEPRTNGAAVDIKGTTVAIAKRMGIYERLRANRLSVETVEFKNADDVTEGSLLVRKEGEEYPDDEIEIEREKFLAIIMDDLKNDVEFMFNNSITALQEREDEMDVSFKNGFHSSYHLVFGCDGMHSGVRRLWFGEEAEYVHFLGAYFSLTIVNKLLIKEKTMQMYNTPGKAITLNAYNNKTDIIFCFSSENEIPYDYRDAAQQKQMIIEQFTGGSWRTAELLDALQQSKSFYFDKFCQVKMPSWTKGRVALAGDAGYCASPAAGMGASLSMEGAAALADSLNNSNGNFEAAFLTYNETLRAYIKEVQATAEQNIKEIFIPETEEEIRKRNEQVSFF